MRTVEEIIETAMMKTSKILKDKAEKRIKYQKKVKNREKLNKKK